MTTDQIMIKAEGVSKEYRLGAIGGTTLKEDLQRLSAKLRKKDDPTLKIGQKAVENVGERFKALNGITFEIKKGEAVGIIGHNGAGKSTLLKLITRVTAPTSGYIGLNGRVASMLEVGTGFHPELTGRENIYMNGAILGMNRKEIDEKIEQIIDFSEVRQFIDTPVKRYSSGMYVKLAFSVAAHLDSEIVIMDEVLAVGDMAFQKKCLDKMRDAATTEGKTVLYVSHNMNTIRQLCDRVIVLDKGQIVFDGDVEEGIATYIGKNMQYGTKINLSSYKRLDFLKRTDVRFLSAEYPDKNDTIFQRKEPLKIKLSWKNNNNVKNLGFRLVVYGADNTHLCAAFIYDMYSGEAETTVEANLSLDISMLSPGSYQSYYVFFLCNEFGATEDIDQVRGLDFIIDDSKEIGKLIWRTNAWGHFEIPSPKIDSIRETKL